MINGNLVPMTSTALSTVAINLDISLEILESFLATGEERSMLVWKDRRGAET